MRRLHVALGGSLVLGLLLGVRLLAMPDSAAGASAVPTTLTLAVTSPGSITPWTPITFTATVAPAPGAGPSVFFYGDSQPIGAAALDAGGHATITYDRGFDAGVHAVFASFGGTAGYGPSASSGFTVTVVDDREPVTVTMAASSDRTVPTALFGVDVTVSPNPGGGTIRFVQEPSTSIGNEAAVGPDGTAHTDLWMSPVGTHDFRACFSGSASHQPACSAWVAHTVYLLSSTTTLSITPPSVYPDQSFMIAGDVSPAPAEPGVVYLDRVGTLPLDGAGHFETTLTSGPSSFPIGEFDLRATFPGSADIAPSQSEPRHLSIFQDPSSITVSVESGEVGDPITIHVAVDPIPAEGTLVSVSVHGPPGFGYGVYETVTLGADGTGSAMVDTDHFWTGTWGYLAEYGGTMRVAKSTTYGEFTLTDSIAPTGSVVIALGEDRVIGSMVGVGLYWDDGVGSGVVAAYYSTDGETWTQAECRPGGCGAGVELPTGDGERTVWGKWVDMGGNWSMIESDTVVVEWSLGVVTPPAEEPPPSGDPVDGGLLPVNVVFNGAQSDGVVAAYEVAQSVDGGAFSVISTVPVAGVTSNGSIQGAADTAGTGQPTTVKRRLSSGHTYRFKVRAVDRGGTRGAWATQSAGLRLTGYQQSSTSVRYSGSWRTIRSTRAWGGSTRRATSAGAAASIRTSSRAIAWVARTGPGMGKATVWVNGRRVTTVNLNRATWSGARVVWSRAWSSVAIRTVKITVAGTAGHPVVEVDGFYTLR